MRQAKSAPSSNNDSKLVILDISLRALDDFPLLINVLIFLLSLFLLTALPHSHRMYEKE